MKSSFLLTGAISFLLFAGCQQQERYAADEVHKSALNDTTSVYGLEGDNAKLVKTASLQCKVKEVEKSSREVSHIARSLGGMIFNQSLQNSEGQRNELKLSDDSLVVISTVYTTADITARVPSEQLETFMYAVADLGYFTQSSQLHIDDRSLVYLRNALKQKNRKEVLEQNKKVSRLPTSLQTIAVKDDMAEQEIANRQIDTDVQYSVVHLNLFQNAMVKREVVANHNLSGYGLPFGKRLGHALENGWSVFLNFVVGVAHLWMFLVALVLGWTGYKMYQKKQVVV